MKSAFRSALGRTTCTVALGTTALLAGAELAAQDLAAESALEEVIVTAQKREQSIRDVGMSINAATGDQLRALGIVDTSDLGKLDASFSFSRSIYGTPVYTMRGVGFNDVSLGAPPTVSAYTDEVPFAFSSLTKGATLDIERVEILRGPQGTLFGQNATGGAINYVAAKPTDSFEAGINGSLARFEAVDVDAYVSGPLSDTLRARVALRTRQGGAWQRAYTRDDEHGDTDQVIGRVLLDWTPSDAWDVRLNLNGWQDRSESQVSQLVAVHLLNPEFGDRLPELFAVPAAPRRGQAAEWDPGVALRNDETFRQASLRIDYSISERCTLTSITAYSDYDQRDTRDLDGQPFETLGIIAIGAVESFSQELRASGSVGEGKLNWLSGVNYTSDEVFDDVAFLVADSPSTFAFEAFGIGRYLTGGPIATQEMKTGAVFGNLEYFLLDTLSVHVGARYTDSNNDFRGCSTARDDNLAAGLTAVQSLIKGGVGVVPVGNGECYTMDETFTPGMHTDSLDETNVSWRFGVDWKPVEDTLIYATVSKGYKAGSFPATLVATQTVQLKPVTQESVLAYEVGFKAQPFAGRLDLTGAYFYYEYADKQLRGRIPDPAGLFGNLEVLVNVPDSKVNGLELAARWLPIDGLIIKASATYLDTRVTSDFFNFDAFGNNINFKDEPFPYAPEHAGSFGAEYSWDLTGSLVAVVGFDANYRSSTVSGFGTDKAIANGFPSQRIDGHSLLDVRVGVASADQRWSLIAWGRNVTDEYYWADAQRNIDTVSRTAGMPVTYGVTVSYRFH